MAEPHKTIPFAPADHLAKSLKNPAFEAAYDALEMVSVVEFMILLLSGNEADCLTSQLEQQLIHVNRLHA